MNGPDIIASITFDIERQIELHHPELVTDFASPVSLWVASALLQKSIRRGRTDFGLYAANYLLRNAPERFWRRCTVVAIEDVGLGDLEAVYTAVVTAAKRKNLVERFGHWRAASFVVTRLANAAKCRGTDDLHVATEDCPEWKRDRLEFSDVPFRDLLDVIGGKDRIERRAIATRYAMGTTYPRSNSLAKRRGQPKAVFEFLCEVGFAHTLVEIGREAYRQTGEVICAFLPLLHREFGDAKTEVRSDIFPNETNIGGIPGWALDMFSREGRRALAAFLKTDCPAANWLRVHVAPSERMRVLGHAVFRVESGLVANRLIWPTGINLLRQADLHSFPLSSSDTATMLTLLRNDIDVLNRERANVR